MRAAAAATLLFLATACATEGDARRSRAATPQDVREEPAKPGAPVPQRPPGGAEPVVYRGNPMLTLYVDGPDPVANPDVVAGVYDTDITVVNTGDHPARLERGHVSFEAWHGDERRACAPVDPVELPPILPPGESHTFQARAVCLTVQGDGDREVRAYVTFAAEGAGVDLARHYAGRYFITR